jgi:hypothetical protein
MCARFLNRTATNVREMQVRGQPSGRWRTPGESADTRQSALASALLSVAVVTATVALVSGAGAGAVPGLLAQADEEDFAPPKIEPSSPERVDMDTIELVVSDNQAVDTATIQQNDFEVTPGNVVGVSAGGSGTEAEVEVRIEDAGNRAVTISTTNDTEISDTNGNDFTGEFDAIVEAPADPPRLSRASWADATRARQYEGAIDWPDDKPGETTVLELYLTDGTGIDTTSVDPDDFTVSRARVADAVAEPDGENAYVLLVLSQNLDDGGLGDGGLTVGLDEDATIRDTEGRVGNRIVRPGPELTLYNTGPNLAGASRVNDTAVQLTFADDTDVAESSIQAQEIQLLGADLPDTEVTDFGARNVDPATLREYPIAGIHVTEVGSNASAIVAGSEEGYLDGVAEVGSNASVLVRMPRPVDDDELLVRVRPDAEITDTIGNAYRPADDDIRNRYVVDGMDGVAPDVEDFSVARTASGGARLSLSTSERLAGIDVSVQGATSDSIDESAFALTPGSQFTYEATYSSETSGTLVFRLEGLTDDAGNTRRVDVVAVRNGTAREPRPEPVIALDFEASGGDTYVFDARHTSSASPVTNYTWEFGDGTTGSGLRVRKQFDPGSHLVALTATDAAGRSATETATLDLTARSVRNVTADQLDGIRRVTDPDLRVVRGSGTGQPTRLEVRNPSPGMAVRASPQDGALAAGEAVTLDGVEVVPARYDDFSLALSATGAGTVSGAAAGDDRTVGGFAVEHDVPDSGFEGATLSASVDAARLDALGSDPGDVTVYRRHDGAWRRLPTSRSSGGGTDGTARFRVESPGFSRFAVVVTNVTAPGEPTPTPVQNATDGGQNESGTGPADGGVQVRNATLNRTSVAPGGVVLVNATLENPAGSNTIYTAGLSVNGTTVATEQVTLPAGERRTVALRAAVDATGTVPVAVNGTSAGELTVGGGGLLGSVLGVFGPLAGLVGVLPLGLVRSLLMFVGIPALVVYLILKGLAIYLGY